MVQNNEGVKIEGSDLGEGVTERNQGLWSSRTVASFSPEEKRWLDGKEGDSFDNKRGPKAGG